MLDEHQGVSVLVRVSKIDEAKVPKAYRKYYKGLGSIKFAS